MRELARLEIIGRPTEDISFTVICYEDSEEGGRRSFEVVQTGAGEALYESEMSDLQAIEFVSFVSRHLGIS